MYWQQWPPGTQQSPSCTPEIAPPAACLRCQALGDVFSALAAAVGAAEKVVELMHRQPKVPRAGTLAPAEFSGRIDLQVRRGHTVGVVAGRGLGSWC